jgi:cobalamin biosynthetic protein CobC
MHGLSTDSAPIEHGGRTLAAARQFPNAPRPFIDLSTGINPVPYPYADLPAACFARLPEPEALAALEQMAARHYGVEDAARVVAAPGTQILISLLPRVFPAETVAVLGPTYGEYTASWRGIARVRDAKNLAELEGADCAVVCNPNNPDGRLVSRAALLALRPQVGLLVVDEAFADFDPAESLASAAGVIVLRSFGKSFGLAGVRLGFAIADQTMAERLRAALGPWPVSGPAIAIGSQALADTDWQAAAAARLAQDRARLDGLLRDAGAKILGGTKLFCLAGADPTWHERLGQAGILVRRFAHHPGWLRFGLPADGAAWDRLEAALQ